MDQIFTTTVTYSEERELMNIMNMRGNLWRNCWLLVALAASCTAVRDARATLITLRDENSVANFSTQDSDAGGNPVGLYDWEVNGDDYMHQQWFWYRDGETGPETSLGQLTQTHLATLDLDGDTNDDFLLVRYRDANQSVEIELRYILTGAATTALNSDLVEVISLRNTSNAPKSLHFFQYVDFDLADTSDGDTVVLTGSPANTARQTETLVHVSETVVTPRPSHHEANIFSSTRDRLNDALPTTLNDNAGPLGPADVTWAFQWDFTLAPGQTYLISKDKNLRAEVIPEPSTALLAVLGLAGAALAARRRRTG